MKIGLASDSMGNVEALARALDVFAERGAERVFFLGGRWSDVDAVQSPSRGQNEAVTTDLGFLAAVQGALQRQVDGVPPRAGDALAGKIVRVASKACPEYHADSAPKKLFDMLDNFICCLVHDKADLGRDDIANATLLIHGNTAQPGLVQIGPRYFVTPGHLRADAPEGRPATFALLEVEPAKLELVVFDGATGAELRRETKLLGARGKVSVK